MPAGCTTAVYPEVRPIAEGCGSAARRVEAELAFSPRRPRGVNRLAARAHGDEARDTFDAGLRFCRRLDAMKDRVAIRAVERFEERSRARVSIHRRGEVGG